MAAPRPRLLLLGTGFGAFSLLRRIDARAYDITVVSPRNHFLFTPLLPSTTVGTVEFRTILEPIRPYYCGIRFHLGRAVSLDADARVVRCESVDGELSWDAAYDVLVIGVGCVPNTFGTPGAGEYALFLKELSDARAIRQRLSENLETASLPGVSEAERDRLVHFVAVGAGPTGVRFAAELYDMLVKDLPRHYPNLADRVRVTIVDAGKSLLSAYDQELREYVSRTFAGRGIHVRLESPVSEVGDHHVRLKNGDALECGMVLWTAGFAPHPLVESLPLAKDRSGRLTTNSFLQAEGRPEIYAIGDCACPADAKLPQLAQVAEQQGRCLGDNLNRMAAGRPMRPFTWRKRSVSSYIGRALAVVEGPDGGAHRSGFLAYQQWRAAMWTQLVSVRNKILVPMDRLRSALFGRDLSRF